MNQAVDYANRGTSPFHPGERRVQAASGVREEAEARGRKMLTADLNKNQQDFFHQLPFVVAADIDKHGQPWAGLIALEPGFFHFGEHSHNLQLNWQHGTNMTAIEASPGSQLGLLGIDFATRRRNRLNSTVTATAPDRWQLKVDQGYGNCPKYITERDWPAKTLQGRYALQQSLVLDDRARQLIRSSDTFFIATSAGPASTDSHTRGSAWGTDISHRGGEAGFVKEDSNYLFFKDFPGNNMFNTLGNLHQHPRCGLLFIDFSSGALLQVAAHGELLFDGEPGNLQREVALRVLHCQWWQPIEEQPPC